MVAIVDPHGAALGVEPIWLILRDAAVPSTLSHRPRGELEGAVDGNAIAMQRVVCGLWRL